MGDYKTEPFKSVLLENTEENYNFYGSFAVFTPDTSQTGIKPGLLVYISASATANAVTLCGAFHGDAVKGESTIGIVQIPVSHPSFPKAYDKDTAFTVETDSFKVHWLQKGDKVWVKSASIACTVNELLFCAANGLTALADGATTVDKHNVHAFRPLKATSSKTWTQIQYEGRVSVDAT